jgi:integrase
MAQRKKGDRAMAYRYPKVVPGQPRLYPGYYLVVTIGADGERSQKKYPFATAAAEEVARQDAEGDARVTNEEAELAQGVTIEEAMNAYPERLRKKNRPRTIETNMNQLRNMFPEVARLLPSRALAPADGTGAGKLIYPRRIPLADLTEPFCIALYELLCTRPDKRDRLPAADTTLNTLKTARRFLNFCVERRWARYNVLAAFRPEGERNPGGKGKKQLNFEALAKWEAKAFEMAEAGDEGAAAGLIALKLALRASVVVSRRASHVDLGGAILRVPGDGRANRTKRAPEIIPVMDVRLRPILASLKVGKELADGWLFPASGGSGPGRRRFTEEARRQILAEYDAALASGAGGEEVLTRHGVTTSTVFVWRRREPRPIDFAAGHRNRAWLAQQIRRVCRAAGVSEDTHAHGMRGASASLDHIDGKTLSEIQMWLGHQHGSPVTEGSYLTADAIHRRRQRALMQAVPGGKK